MDWRLEVVVVPVSDVDRAKAFYSEQLGFIVDVDHRPNEEFRVVQLTPPGSGCSIAIGTGLGAMQPGSLKGLQLCVGDIEAARAELVSRGVAVRPVRHHDGTGFVDGNAGDWNSFVLLSDPDGNEWLVQQSPRVREAALAAAEAAG
jgi:catechol 2,3-dioxygenase-like lactoylglutathione lyase family enzyme